MNKTSTISQSNISEGLEFNDLNSLISNVISFDEFKAKTGNDDEMIVAAFKIKGKNAATDFNDFLEKGYDWIIDADVSIGEENGYHYVFVEAQRRTYFVDKFLKMLKELKNLDEEIEEWNFYYFDPAKDKQSIQPVDRAALNIAMPLSPEAYRDVNGDDGLIEQLQIHARIPVQPVKLRDPFTEQIKLWAGVRSRK